MTVEHIMKFLNRKLQKGSYGSVLIHIKDGKVTGIQDKIDYNPEAFVEHIEHSVSRVVVKNKLKDGENGTQKSSFLIKKGQDCATNEQNNVQDVQEDERKGK